MDQLKFRSVIPYIAVLGGMLAMVGCNSGVKPQKAIPAQASTGQSAAKEGPVTMVSIPDDIGCSVKGMQIMSMIGSNGETNNTSGSVKGVTCWIKDKKPVKKDIPLASETITDGMLPTKRFGNLQISQENNINSNGLYMAIGSDKLKAFRDYLQQ
jgi:hypothetical protein